MRSLIEVVGKLVGPILPYLFSFVWPLVYVQNRITAKSSEKKVLLVARNLVAADHLICVADLLKGTSSVRIYTTVDRCPNMGFSHQSASEILDVPGVHILTALSRHWDLIIFTNHTFGFGLCFSPWLPKLYINHGIHTGKINNNLNEDGVYGREKVIRPFNRPYYHCMFAASYHEKQLALRETPELDGIIEVTGFLRADNFCKFAADNREQLRAKFGLTGSDRVVHIISTWGSSCLYNLVGSELLDQIPFINGYKFILSLHPRYDELSENSKESRSEIQAKFSSAGVLIDKGLDWQCHVAVSDAVISDHSSLLLYHILIGHPVLLADVDEAQFVSGSTFDLLRQLVARFCHSDSLEKMLDLCVDGGSSYPDAFVQNYMLNFEGEAASRYDEEFSKILMS